MAAIGRRGRVTRGLVVPIVPWLLVLQLGVGSAAGQNATGSVRAAATVVPVSIGVYGASPLGEAQWPDRRLGACLARNRSEGSTCSGYVVVGGGEVRSLVEVRTEPVLEEASPILLWVALGVKPMECTSSGSQMLVPRKQGGPGAAWAIVLGVESESRGLVRIVVSYLSH